MEEDAKIYKDRIDYKAFRLDTMKIDGNHLSLISISLFKTNIQINILDVTIIFDILILQL